MGGLLESTIFQRLHSYVHVHKESGKCVHFRGKQHDARWRQWRCIELSQKVFIASCLFFAALETHYIGRRSATDRVLTTEVQQYHP